MAFDDAQVRKLRARLRTKHIKSRKSDRQTLHYIEGWHAVAEANRIFGFDAWCRETVASECVWRQPQANRFAAAYLARVRITVRAGAEEIVHEGSGAGEAIAGTPGQAHEMASKAAETDATKRALSTFGNPFGLSLYAGTIEKRISKPSPTKATPKPNRSAKPSKARYEHLMPDRLLDKIEVVKQRELEKEELALAKPRRIRDRDHLKFVAAQPCLICDRRPSQAHHIRYAQPRAMGRKVSDEFTVPLCAGHHRELHGFGDERKW